MSGFLATEAYTEDATISLQEVKADYLVVCMASFTLCNWFLQLGTSMFNLGMNSKTFSILLLFNKRIGGFIGCFVTLVLATSVLLVWILFCSSDHYKKLGRRWMYFLMYSVGGFAILVAFSPVMPISGYTRLLLMLPVGEFRLCYSVFFFGLACVKSCWILGVTMFGVFSSFTFYLPELYPVSIR